MLIDSLAVIVLVMAVMKGYSKGLIVAVFSFFAVIIGLVAAMKLSAVVANHLGSATNIGVQWLPVLSFAMVMFATVLLVRWGASLVEKSANLVLMGWVNKMGGIVLYALLYLTVLSVVVFFAEKISIIKPETIAASKTYPLIHFLGPKAVNSVGYIVPVFKGLFEQLSHFFDALSHKIK